MDFVKLQKKKADSDNSWTINVSDIDIATYDLSAKNPNKKEKTALREPKEILTEIAKLDMESKKILEKVIQLL